MKRKSKTTVTEKAIPGWPGYFATTDGKIISTKRGQKRFMSLISSKSGHLRVWLTDGIARRRKALVHHLILETFVGPRPKGGVTRHYPDPTPTNNNLENIQWGTAKENFRDCVEHGRYKKPPVRRGEESSFSKTTNDVAIAIVQLANAGFTVPEISWATGVPQQRTRQIANGSRWPHLERLRKVVRHSQAGTGNHACKISQGIADEIRRLYSTGLTQVAIAKKFDLTQGRISQIVLNKSWVKDGTRTK